MNFSTVASLLLNLGSNLPAVLAFVHAVMTAWDALQSAIGGKPVAARTHSADELAHADKLAGFFNRGGGGSPAPVDPGSGDGPPNPAPPAPQPAPSKFDGHRIAGMIDWLVAHPAILNWIFAMFKIPVPPLPTP
jgi:hypothetical protein